MTPIINNIIKSECEQHITKCKKYPLWVDIWYVLVFVEKGPINLNKNQLCHDIRIRIVVRVAYMTRHR